MVICGCVLSVCFLYVRSLNNSLFVFTVRIRIQIKLNVTCWLSSVRRVNIKTSGSNGYRSPAVTSCVSIRFIYGVHRTYSRRFQRCEPWTWRPPAADYTRCMQTLQHVCVCRSHASFQYAARDKANWGRPTPYRSSSLMDVRRGARAVCGPRDMERCLRRWWRLHPV